ncbi:MAG TPA: hypothetical protein VIF62_27000 [Labilithrix sp.]|jgi:hypothetical protein
MTRARIALAATASLGAALAACQILAGIHDEDGADRPVDAALASDVVSPTADAGVDARIACRILDASPAPAAPAGDPTAPTTVFALRSISFAPIGGIDLDCRDTRDGGDAPCRGSPDDGEGGADQAYNVALADQVGGGGTGDPTGDHFTSQFQLGGETVLISVADLTLPFPTDATGLHVGIIGSYRLKSVDCAGPLSVVDAGTEGGTPKWDGCDEWWQVHDLKTYVTTNAFLSGGTLYATFEDPVRIDLNEMTVTIQHLFLTATFVTNPGAGADGGTLYALQRGVLAGRMTPEDATLATLNYHTSLKPPLCQQLQALPVQLRDAVCTRRDLPLSGSGAPDETCETVSIALPFEAVSALSHGAEMGYLFDNDAGCPAFDASCPPPP